MKRKPLAEWKPLKAHPKNAIYSGRADLGIGKWHDMNNSIFNRRCDDFLRSRGILFRDDVEHAISLTTAKP